MPLQKQQSLDPLETPDNRPPEEPEILEREVTTIESSLTFAYQSIDQSSDQPTSGPTYSPYRKNNWMMEFLKRCLKQIQGCHSNHFSVSSLASTSPWTNSLQISRHISMQRRILSPWSHHFVRPEVQEICPLITDISVQRPSVLTALFTMLTFRNTKTATTPRPFSVNKI